MTHEIDDTQPEPCPECSNQKFYRIWKVEKGEQHPLDHDNKHMETIYYECSECGEKQKVRPDIGESVDGGSTRTD